MVKILRRSRALGIFNTFRKDIADEDIVHAKDVIIAKDAFLVKGVKLKGKYNVQIITRNIDKMNLA